MPDMDGLELLRYCKEVSPSAAFILITGVPTINTAIDAVNFGADRYVIKGDRLLDELRPAVKEYAETQALKKEAAICAAVSANSPDSTTSSAPARKCANSSTSSKRSLRNQAA